MNKALLLVAFASLWVSPAYAARLDAEVRKTPDPRTEAEKKFRKKQIADKIAFDRSLEGKSLADQRANHAGYVADRLQDEKKHAENLKKIERVREAYS
jgi:hypothetical protein